MGSGYIVKAGDACHTPLWAGTDQNVKLTALQGQTSLKLYENELGLREPFTASMGLGKGDGLFESACIAVALEAIESAGIDPRSKEVVFILSSTKGNVSVVEEDPNSPAYYLGETAQRISRHFGNPNTPIVVSNACISGVDAQITATRLIASGAFKTSVVIGADVLSKFIISGFQSFKALSPERCRPFDADRKGLNLGEAASAMVLTAKYHPQKDDWVYLGGSVHNDANHISGPSRTGEGLFQVLQDLKKVINTADLGFINVHGTATAYNDEMEATALHRAELDSVPVTCWKSYFGHTLGAAGVLETLLSMKALDMGIVPGIAGYRRQGTTHPLNIQAVTRPGKGNTFLKLLSGFGGVNGGVAYRKGVEP